MEHSRRPSTPGHPASPTTTALVTGVDPYTGQQLGTDPITGVITGRVAYDPDDALQFTLTAAPAQGTVVFHPDGTFTYAPDLSSVHAAGETDSFTVVVNEATGPNNTTITTVGFGVAAHDTVVDAIRVGNGPAGLVVTPDGTRLYVVNSTDETVSVVDTSTNTVAVPVIDVGESPRDIAVSPDGTRVYVTNRGDSTISIVDSDLTSATFNTVLATSGVFGPDPHIDAFNSLQVEDAAVNPGDGTVWVTTYNSFSPLNNVWIVDPDTGTMLHSFRADGDLADPGDAVMGDIEFDPGRPYAYLADINGRKVLVVDTTTNSVVQAVVGLGQTPQELILSPDGNTLYVNHNIAGNVSIVDVSDPLNPAVVTVDDGVIPDLFAELGIGGGRAYVTKSAPIPSDPTDDVVTVVDLTDNSFVRNIPVGTDPVDVTVSPNGTRVYVTNATDGTVSVIAVLLPAT